MTTRRTSTAKATKVSQTKRRAALVEAAEKEKQRLHTRLAVNLLIDYQVLDQFLYDYATNISLGGVFIRSQNPLPVGTKLRVQFSLPGLEETVVTWGEVAHVIEERAKEGFRGMGIRFDDLDPKSKKVIDQLVAHGAHTLLNGKAKAANSNGKSN
jgi:type IV pilus assembly protein PilZ